MFSIPSLPSIFDSKLAQNLQVAIDQKTKPPGSLGMLEQLAQQIGLIVKNPQPQIIDPTIFIFAADHGVVAEQISAYPQCVTWQMVENFLASGAAINVFAQQNGARLCVVDAGVNHDFGARDNLIDRKIAHGSANFAQTPAMQLAQCEQALLAGQALMADCPGNVVGFGEMGIGNTTASAALMHLLTDLPLSACVGSGTGLDNQGVQHKQQVIANAIALHRAQGTVLSTPLEILACFGGFEIAMMIGAMLEAARLRKVLLIDGFIVSTALLVACRMQPTILEYCVFSHCSAELGHQHLLAHLSAQPLLALNLRLGEGTGCALALPLLEAAVNFLQHMASFEAAQVSQQNAA